MLFNLFSRKSPDQVVKDSPHSIKAWLKLIDYAAKNGQLSPHHLALYKSHKIFPDGHAVNSFKATIEKNCGDKLKALAASPIDNAGEVIEEFVKWKTIAQCGHSHDVSKGYFIDAESVIEYQWSNLIYPIIKDLDFSSVLDLACGHGRNSEYLRKHTKELHLLDVNQSCLDACKERFGDEKEGTKFYYHLTQGNNLKALPDSSITLVYTWDSMVHFDKLVVKDYVLEIKRVLKPGGYAFLHHSNYGAVAPDTDWAQNTGTRSDMSAELMHEYANQAGLEVVKQQLQGRKEGWGTDDLDCVSLLRRPTN
jgi:SAM-dependent methyltransferase